MLCTCTTRTCTTHTCPFTHLPLHTCPLTHLHVRTPACLHTCNFTLPNPHTPSTVTTCGGNAGILMVGTRQRPHGKATEFPGVTQAAGPGALRSALQKILRQPPRAPPLGSQHPLARPPSLPDPRPWVLTLITGEAAGCQGVSRGGGLSRQPPVPETHSTSQFLPTAGPSLQDGLALPLCHHLTRRGQGPSPRNPEVSDPPFFSQEQGRHLARVRHLPCKRPGRSELDPAQRLRHGGGE